MTMPAELPEAVRQVIGTEIELGWGVDVVEKAMVRHWCEALEDANPLYTEEAYARQSEHGGLIAPPPMAAAFARPPMWPPAPERGSVMQRIPLHIPEAAVQGVEWEFFAPMRVGDRLRLTERLADVSTARTTRLGTGHFVTVQRLYHNQRGELVATLTSTSFRYARGSPRRS